MTEQDYICPGTCEDVNAAFGNGFGAGFYACSELLEKMAQKEGITFSKDFIKRLQAQSLKSYKDFERYLTEHGV